MQPLTIQPTRILLVKTSSLGDVVHNLPVITDIRLNAPSAEIDWAVEHTFREIPRFHPGVREVIPVELRKWRRGLLDRETWRALRELRERFRAAAYDFVIDTQGLIKSAVITRLAPGTRIGLDWISSREPLRLFYDRTFHVPWGQHAVERNRQLAAKALGYSLQAPARYGITAPALDSQAPWVGALSQRPYAVLLHATSASAKLWPEHQWVKLGDHLQHRGIVCVLPWGNDAERERSERIASLLKSAIVPPRLTLTEAAGLLGHAQIGFRRRHRPHAPRCRARRADDRNLRIDGSGGNRTVRVADGSQRGRARRAAFGRGGHRRRARAARRLAPST